MLPGASVSAVVIVEDDTPLPSLPQLDAVVPGSGWCIVLGVGLGPRDIDWGRDLQVEVGV